jgi:hypothetical protein
MCLARKKMDAAIEEIGGQPLNLTPGFEEDNAGARNSAGASVSL